MKIRFLFLAPLVALLFTACVDRDFDEPPVNGTNPDIDASQIVTIDEIKDLYIPGEFTAIDMDKYLSVIVSADDNSGNFFRTIVVQDETGGMSVLLDDVELWNRFPEGRRIFIHLADLWISDFNGLPQIGYAPFDDGSGFLSLGRIPAVLIDDVVLRGELNNEITNTVLDLTQLGNKALNTLITINDVQFISSATGQTYADAANQGAINHFIEDCNGNAMIVRTSGYSDFAADIVPGGNGSITAIYSIFGADKQLLLRTPDDVNMEGDRCGEVSVEVDPNKVISIQEVISDYFSPGQEISLPDDAFIKGSVVSDDAEGNFYKALVVQDGGTGLVVLVDGFDLYESYPRGNEVYVSLKDMYIGEFNGLPQLGYEPATGNVRRIPEGEIPNYIINTGMVNTVTPQVINVADVDMSMLNTLVQFNDVQFEASSANATYADGANQFSVNHIVEDCDVNQILLRTSGFANFADNRTPNGKGSLTGVLQVYQGDYQIFLRDLGDVSMNGPRCGETGMGGGDIDEMFEDQADFDPINLSGWTNVATKGDRVWIKRSFDNNGFAETEAFQDTNPETENWLVTPEINTNMTSTLSFQSAMAFFQHEGLSVWVASDFSGDVSSATWTQLTANIANNSNANYDWVDSGDIDLSSYGDNVHVAFMYEGTSAQNTTKYRLDNIMVR